MPAPEQSRREYMRAYMKARRAAEREARLAAGENVRRGRPKKKVVKPKQSRRSSRVYWAGGRVIDELRNRSITEISCHALRRLIEQKEMYNCNPITQDEIVRAVFEWAEWGIIDMPEFSRRGWPKTFKILPKKP